MKPSRRSSSEEPLAKMAKKHDHHRENENSSDHLAEITQLKEKIASMQRTVNSKNNELLAKAGEITAMKAKLFNEEKLIKEKMKKMQKAHDDKVAELNHKINSLQGELTRVRREAANSKAKTNVKKNELFPGANKKDLISHADLRPKEPSRTESPAPTAQSSRSQSRSRSRSRSPRSRSRSRSKSKSKSRSRSRSRSASSSRSRSKSPKNSKAGSDDTPKNNEEDQQSNSRPSSRNSSKSNSPVKEQQRQGDVDSD